MHWLEQNWYRVSAPHLVLWPLSLAFEAGVAEWADRLARKSPVLMKLGKDAMFRQQDMAYDDAIDFLRSQLTIAFSTEDIQEGVRAFFEKREPQWKGR